MITTLFLAAFATAQAGKPQIVTASRVIEAPAARVWEAMVLDYGEISNFSPFVYASGYVAGSLEGTLHAERTCHFDAEGTRWTHEQIQAIDHDKMEMRNVVLDAGRFPLDTDASFAWYRVHDNGDGTATATYAFEYRASPGMMTRLMRRSFQQSLEGTLVGLEHYVETGEIVNATTGNWEAISARYP